MAPRKSMVPGLTTQHIRQLNAEFLSAVKTGLDMNTLCHHVLSNGLSGGQFAFLWMKHRRKSNRHQQRKRKHKQKQNVS
ncbi:MAG: hypothetical protein Sylvanvirus40_3 [Sylvanvirus sp.]|uniref:Uncharacterized protein n=1 Tax=Sylvanvirus sp. TaxID=2487774 RepID=A0A3G5AJY8_9VIRU|nr:MAG: hypothetical protein Sylvanvirus40_3 [Sylvanvirus sp.]